MTESGFQSSHRAGILSQVLNGRVMILPVVISRDGQKGLCGDSSEQFHSSVAHGETINNHQVGLVTAHAGAFPSCEEEAMKGIFHEA